MRTLTVARDLTRRKARERSGLFVAEGIRTVEELLASPLRITRALTCDLLDRTPRGVALESALRARGVDVERVDETDFRSASATEHTQGVLAIAERPDTGLGGLSLSDDASVGANGTTAGETAPLRLLILDGIQDPGNAGTLLRTAAAFGVAATVALPGTVDLWNAKVVRSAVGMQFRRPTINSTGSALWPFLRERGIVLWGADATGTPVDDLRRGGTLPHRLALVVGNEGAGLSGDVREACEALVSLPMASGAESLNVAVAAGVLLFALRPSPLL